MKRCSWSFSVFTVLLMATFATSASSASGRWRGDGGLLAVRASASGEAQQGSIPLDRPVDAQWTRAQRMFAGNDFAQASAAAAQVTSPALKADAQTMITQIRAYVAALQAGVEAEDRDDFEAAIEYYTSAAHIKRAGPGDPSARIPRLQGEEASAAQAASQAQRAHRLTQGKAKAAQLLKKGLAEEQAGNIAGASASLAAAQAAFPGFPGVAEAMQRVESKRGPGQLTADENREAAAAIRDFYAGQYGKAEKELSGLSSAPNAGRLGATFFYLGAARLERAVLEEGRSSSEAAREPEVQTAFRQARSLGYVPSPRFVSPVVMSAWEGVL